MQHGYFPLSVSIYAKDAQRLANFYADVVGLSREDEGGSFVLLASNQIELTIVQAPEKYVQSVEITEPPRAREETPIKISFLVSNIELLRQRVEGLGGLLKDASSTWSWRGAYHLDGHDPEGNVFQLRQAHPSQS
jgi:predicted enzyme related to lactoylglutathione lyase